MPTRRRAALLFTAVLGAWLPLAVTPTPGHAEEQSIPGYVTMVSEAGDYIGSGVARTYRPTIANRTDAFLALYAGPYVFRIGAPDGQQLVPGRYDAFATTAGSAAELDIFGSSRACAGSGEFTVLDIAPERIWIRYEFRCEGHDAALFGEIRLGYGEETAPLGVEAATIGFPSENPGVPVRPYPVRVTNNGPSTTTVTSTVKAGGQDFSILDDGCTAPLPPGASCTVQVGWTASRAGARLGMLEVSDGRGQVREVSLSGVGHPGRTRWQMTGDPGDWISGGRSYTYTPQTGALLYGHGSETFAAMGATHGDEYWSARFRAPKGQILLPGHTYTGATRDGFNAGNPGLEVDGSGRGCNTLTGQFTVHEAAYDDGALTGFRISFGQHCEGFAPALRGEVSWRAVDPDAPTPDTTAPAPVTGLTAGSAGASVPISWTNPTDADWVGTVVLGAGGTSAVTEGRVVYDGRGTSTVVTDVPTSMPYTLTALSKDTSGNLSPVRTVTIPATTPPPTTTPPTTPPATPPATPPPTTTTPPTTATSSPTPTTTPSATPTPTTTPPLSATAPPLQVLAVRTVALRVARTGRREVRLTGHADTWAAGARALLQRRTDRGWSTVAGKRFSPSGRVRFVVDAPHRTPVRYRLVARTDGPPVVSPAVRVRP